jgi:hypothetical protein
MPSMGFMHLSSRAAFLYAISSVTSLSTFFQDFFLKRFFGIYSGR